MLRSTVIRPIYIFTFLIVLVNACKKKEKLSQAEYDEKLIKKYITDHSLNATAAGNGLYYVMTTTGTGAQPVASSNVTVVYRGTLTDGTEFDKSPAAGSSFVLSNTIAGWREGIPHFKKGGKGMLLVPSAMGYGNQAVGKIPANSVLIFDIELLDVK